MIKQAGVRRYPLWSTKAILLISLPVVVTIAVLVFVLSDRSLFVQTELTLLIISLCLFAFLTIGLYRGVRLERPEKDQLNRSIVQFESRDGASGPWWRDLPYFLLSINPPDLSRVELPHVGLPHDVDIEDDLLGCLGAIILWIAAALLLMVLLWLLTQFIAALPVFAAVLYWIFYRALRVVFARSRACKGRLLPSMGYGLFYTVLYSGWMLALLSIVHFLLPKV